MKLQKQRRGKRLSWLGHLDFHEVVEAWSNLTAVTVTVKTKQRHDRMFIVILTKPKSASSKTKPKFRYI